MYSMKKILVVDDEENIQLLYQEELNQAGFQTITAKNGDEALLLFNKAKPDLVTIDLKMEGMDGFELLNKIRELDMEIPIIIVTAYGEYKQDFNVWASDAYITKSSDPSELVNTIKGILSRSE
ncbi:MAG: two-component system response regulator [Candidatus Schekmanbacteria bacterium RBG_13_48_7]|uniref:Two-component system response regulator n=1 Tax=Candidatus Schekmanbacteria bacterium RBG_13_48_7 TaxID=1817878 RepID=A0A1F7RQM5_9BACT|nr:MAG: two-component system response regulator [Candidatus Schekmanbacteria bacterium RBG_13_48_7]